MYSTIIFEKKKNVAWLTLNRPEKLNAFNREMQTEILQAIKEVKEDDTIRCLVITGKGRAFCSGQDLSSVPEGTDYGELLKEGYNPLIEDLVALEIPVVAAVNGVAAGAGFSLALACDFRIASDKASFIQAFIHVGLVPDSGSFFFLPRLIGYAKALELSILGERISAEEALQMDLLTIMSPHDDLMNEVTAFSNNLASMPTKAIGLIKKTMQASFETDLSGVLEKEASAQRIAGQSMDHKEGVTAFLEKRKPNFTGK